MWWSDFLYPAAKNITNSEELRETIELQLQMKIYVFWQATNEKVLIHQW